MRTPEARAKLSAQVRAEGNPNYRPLRERFEEKVQRGQEPGDCDTWIGGTFNTGYGMIDADGRSQLAHRVGYELAGREIPEGAQLHHTCENQICVRPAHLLPVLSTEHRAVHREQDAIVVAIVADDIESGPSDHDELTRDELEALSRAQLAEAVTG
jgi:hypothetical protein